MITNGFEALTYLDAEAEVNIKVSNNDSQDSSEDITENIDKVEENIATDDKQEEDMTTEIENVEATMKYMNTLLDHTSLLYQIMNISNTVGISKTLYRYLEQSSDISSIFKTYKIKIPSVENFNSYLNSDFVSATESALQSIKQKLINVGKAIYKFIQNIFSKITNLFKSYKTKVNEHIKIIEESDKTPEFNDDKYKKIKVLKFEKSEQLIKLLKDFMTTSNEINDVYAKLNEVITNSTQVEDFSNMESVINKILDKFKINPDEDLVSISESTNWKQKSNILQTLKTLDDVLKYIDVLKKAEAQAKNACKQAIDQIPNLGDEEKALFIKRSIKFTKNVIKGLISSSNKIVAEHIKISQLYISDIKKEKKENTDNLE